MTNEEAVLDWALFQAGIKPSPKHQKEEESLESVVEEVMEEIDDMLTFPGASAETEPEPVPEKPAASKAKVENKSEEEATPEPLSEIVDIIKNDNNVVVFFCKYFYSFFAAFTLILYIVRA